MKLERLCAQRRKESAEACELPVGAGERPRQLRDLLHANARARTGLRAQERSQSPLGPQPLTLECEGVGVPVRQRVLDDGTRRLLRTRGRIEKRPNLGQDSGEAAVHSSFSIRRRARRRHGPPGLSSGRLRPMSRGRPDPPPARSSRRPGAPTPPSSAASTVRSRCRTSIRHARQPSPSIFAPAPSSTPATRRSRSCLPRTRSCRWRTRRSRSSGPGYRFHTEIVGRGTLVGDVWHGDLWLRGYGDPTLGPADLAALATDVASWGIRRVDGAVIADESWFDAGPGRPRLEARLLHLRVAAAVGARRRPRTVPRPHVREPGARSCVTLPAGLGARAASRSPSARGSACPHD